MEIGYLNYRHAARRLAYALYTSQRIASRLVYKDELEGLVFR